MTSIESSAADFQTEPQVGDQALDCACPSEGGVVIAPPAESKESTAIGGWSSQFVWRSSSLLISLILHAAAVLVLGFAFIWSTSTAQPVTITVLPEQDEEEPVQLEVEVHSPDFIQVGDIPSVAIDVPQHSHVPDALNVPSPFAGLPKPPIEVGDNHDVTQVLVSTNLMSSVQMPRGGGFEGRTSDAKSVLIRQRGGTPESEEAVEMALAYLAAHQRPDGGWRFDFKECPCEGKCQDSGTIGSATGATGLALLPFLGAGYTHLEGPYQEVVQKGVYYLASRMIRTPHGGDLQEGTMYAQGIATLALCEAYGMTGDKNLKDAAQKAVDFIVYAQHPKGGWRYYPGQPGDTTVFGWQLMALKSAVMAGLFVPSPVFEMAKGYLDTVQSGGGSFYGYVSTDKATTPTAVGLLSRMYLGWHRDDVRLKNGVSYLFKLGPSRNDVYFNYYATQVMIHYGQPYWQRWNKRLREQLIDTQSKRGHDKGSWFFHEKHALAGGRLYTTAVAAMILEVYYRHMPLYDQSAIDW